ncbi:hypothetical protein [Sphingomicrobium astaxanthinifaciens]|uniref:hypothetical protein n=1 Tax=Sphingomicrobium astaxanthinifaciens TaxID=1227949 RepID=UPI001FCAA3BF|nr:hypothetical protein [Sphingomicrobium astaxanthinifaciens]MCJ7421778.1 hypothetical protein [Sphingomicrobium astaxanthinifaciens]
MTVRLVATAALFALALAPDSAHASASASASASGDAGASADAPRPAIGASLFASSDADGTEVTKLGIDFDLARVGREEALGVRLERARFAPAGGTPETATRAYLRLVRPVAPEWQIDSLVGTDGERLLGTAALVHAVPLRKEFFVEREIVETPQGLALGLSSTLAGASLDVPLGARAQLTLVGAALDFSGDNRRLHARANAIYAIAPDAGVSLQLRGRYFRDSVPREYDYYAPGDYLQLLPVVQVQRFAAGWRYRLAGGWGAQKERGSDWRGSRLIEARVTSPASGRVSLEAQALYSEVPTILGEGYAYGQVALAARTRL